jgi:hypothetical protein
MITTQTKAAFERIEEALVGKTEDRLDLLIANLDRLLDKAKEIKKISTQNRIGDYS